DEINSSKLRVQRNVLVVDADPERRLALVEAIRDGVTSVTPVGRIVAKGQRIEFQAYDAIVLGFGRSGKDNAKMIEELAAAIEGLSPKLVFFAP
ncbi:hypothetical protein, partial [Mesorhizobium sp. M3A.F.Ca.ET.174.01.1.1]